MRFRAVIFDLDGTLVSVKKEYRDLVMGKVFGKLRIKPAEGDIEQFWFMHSRDTIIRKWGIDPDVFWKVFWKYDDPLLRKKYSFAFRDTDYLETLRQRGINTAVFTGAIPEIAQMELSILGERLFDTVVIAHPDLGIDGKPHPGGAIECMRKMKVSRPETIYVGNADEDILSARNAGIYSVLIDRKEHRNVLKADMKITSLYELDRLL